LFSRQPGVDLRRTPYLRYAMVSQLCFVALLQLALITFQIFVAGNPTTVESQAVSILAAVLAVVGSYVKQPIRRTGFMGAGLGAWLAGAVLPPYVPLAFPFVIAYAVPASVSWLIFATILAAMAAAWREGRFPRGSSLAVALVVGGVIGAVVVAGLEIAAAIVVVLVIPGFGSF
jgi:hypothetical protein